MIMLYDSFQRSFLEITSLTGRRMPLYFCKFLKKMKSKYSVLITGSGKVTHVLHQNWNLIKACTKGTAFMSSNGKPNCTFH